MLRAERVPALGIPAPENRPWAAQSWRYEGEVLLIQRAVCIPGLHSQLSPAKSFATQRGLGVKQWRSVPIS